jgi:membrane-associated phospholipid phosphatase
MRKKKVSPLNETRLPEKIIPGEPGRVILRIRKYRPVAWMLFLTTSLVLFLAWMPAQMRAIIWHALVARGILSGLLLVFSLLAVSLVWSVGQRVDVWAFLFFNLRGARPAWLDWIMLGFTQIGSGLGALVVGLVLLFASDRLLAYEFILGSLTLWMLVELLKALVRRSRPSFRVTQARIVGLRAIGQSFPSGHTSQAFFAATLIAPYFYAGGWMVFLLYGTALLVGITRMYVGAHYPRDVLAGAILGSAWGLLGALVNGYVLNGAK